MLRCAFRTVNQSLDDSGFTSDGEGHPSSGSSGEHLPTHKNSNNNNGHCYRVQGHNKHQRQKQATPQQLIGEANGATLASSAAIDSDLGHETDFSMSK